jgi:uncharacterized membrane protein YoaK (UPF0700 family)
MLDKFFAGVNVIQDNVWAFSLFLLASLIAIASCVLGMVIVFHYHSTEYGIAKDLLQFASTVAMTGAALFHGKEKKD